MRPKHVRLRLVAATAVVSLFAALGLTSPTMASAKPAAAADTNLAAGKPITASSHVFDFVETNANDNNVGTYWESAGGAYPATLSVNLGAKATISSVVVKLNPDQAWVTRTQTIEVLGRPAHSGNYTSLVGARSSTFNPSSGANTLTIPVSATAADVQLKFTTNSGAPGGQVAEFQVMGSPAPAPDLTISDMSWAPASPIETDSVTLRATVRNTGTAASGATNVNFSLAGQKVGTASVGALAAGASSAVSVSAGTRNAGTYQLGGKVDEADTVLELNENNNAYTSPSSLVVAPVAGSDLVASSVSWTPGNPSSGNNVSFSVAVRNQGTVASASGSHGITLTLLREQLHREDPHRLGQRSDRRGRHRAHGEPGRLDGGERQVHRQGRAGQRHERAAGQAGQQHQHQAVLRRPRREHALWQLRGRGRRPCRRCHRRRPEPYGR
jgi:hypothetical protein